MIIFNANALDLPLYGINLIEASAGTGKTHLLVTLYLRLLLHLGNQTTAYVRPLTTEEILIVTFSKTAVETLKNRIKESIRQLRLDCMKGYSNNSTFSQILSQIHDINIAITLLLEAEKKLHHAPIYTIHSFCQKILHQYTIHLNLLFDFSILDNETEVYQKICNDFWRYHFYLLPLNIISLIETFWKNPYDLLHDVLPYIYGEIPNLLYFDRKNDDTNISKFYLDILNNINNVKEKWKKYNIQIIEIINSYYINPKIYNTRNLLCWINKVNQWTTQPTVDHTIPNDLKNFDISTLKTYDSIKKNTKVHILFISITELYKKLSSFKALIFNMAITEIRQKLLHMHLSTQSEITLNNLIEILAHHLTQKNNTLAHIIRKHYPVTIIDEFQDTDQQQYKIFFTLYNNYPKNGLILIGDPKQSIYTFRGADIFTYIKARKNVHHIYNLNINWRSSPGIVNATNQLFQYTSNPFFLKDIPFFPSIPAQQNNTHKFLINNIQQPAICFWLYPNEMITIEEYKKIMAEECANNICNILSCIQNQTAWINNNNHKRIVQAADITILIRNQEEASLIRSTLSKLNISTVFLSNQKDIFQSIEAYELLLLLKAILSLEHNMICTALTTIYFNLKATDIENIKNNPLQWNKTISEFSEYHSVWKSYGIYPMIQQIIFNHKIPERLLSIQQGKSSVINILHLGELLQSTTKEIKGEYELVEWLFSKITQFQNKKILNQRIRLNNTHQLIKISTIHKSKGLEFPLIFLPFIASFNYTKNNCFHHRTTYKLNIDLHKSKENIHLADEERLSEDLRLLYVAITRSIYHCSMGIASIISNYRRKFNKYSDVHHSAIGYLIQQKNSGNAEFLKKQLHILSEQSNQNISLRHISLLKKNISVLPSTTKLNQHLCSKKWKINTLNINSHTITSYSTLKNTQTSTKTNLLEQLLFNSYEINDSQKENHLLTPHTFPKGKMYGKFFHDLFEKLDFEKNINEEQLRKCMDKYHLNLHWKPIIQTWINTIVHTPLNNKYLTLSQITSENKQTECKFYLSIRTHLQAKKLNDLCRKNDSLSSQAPSLTFSTIQGILQGFIDLIFRWNHKYYLLDYKTNWLGSNNNAYIRTNIEQEIIKYRYDLQYQLYTLALHRYLRHRIYHYDYNKHFGGIYYLFIRGLNHNNFDNGIYFIKPLYTFINKLDNLFSTK